MHGMYTCISDTVNVVDMLAVSSHHNHPNCIVSTAGSAHDTVCLRLFAAGLLAAGLKDEAAGVYYSLLHEGADRAQQVACSHCSSIDICTSWYAQIRALSRHTGSRCGTYCLSLDGVALLHHAWSSFQIG